jgi:hypothetical protein
LRALTFAVKSPRDAGEKLSMHWQLFFTQRRKARQDNLCALALLRENCLNRVHLRAVLIAKLSPTS